MPILKIAVKPFAQNSFFGHGEANHFPRASRDWLATFATDKPAWFLGSGNLKPEHRSDGTHDLLSIYKGIGWYEKVGAGVYAVISATNLTVTRLAAGRFRVTAAAAFFIDEWGLDVHAHQFVPGWPGTMVNPVFAAEAADDINDVTAYNPGGYQHSATVREFDVYGTPWGSGYNHLTRADPDVFIVGTIGNLL